MASPRTTRPGSCEEIRTYSSVEHETKDSGQPPEQRAPAEAGMNRFIWHMRYPDARKVPGDKTMDDQGFGPLAPPGSYQVRLKVGEGSRSESFLLVKDPRVMASQEDFDAQFDLLLKIRDRLSETHDSINKLRSVRQQVEEWIDRTKELASEEAVSTAGEEIKEKLKAVEDELVQVGYTGARDRLNLPAGLNAKLAAITGVVAAADFAPPNQALEVFEDVSARIQPHLDRVEEIIEKDVSTFENLIHELGIPAIVPRTS